MANLRRAEFNIDGIRIVASAELEADGSARVVHLEVSGRRITTEALRRVPISVIEASARWTADPGDLDNFEGRRPGEDPIEFSRRVTKAYRAAASRSSRPNKLIAQQADVPVSTVRGWIREARLRGLLEPGTQGKAG